MKKFELIIGLLTAALISLNIWYDPFGIIGSSGLSILAAFALILLYFFFGFALFNNIRIRGIFKRNSYKNISVLRILGSIFVGICLSITVIAILFHFQVWPGAIAMMYLWPIGMILVLLAVLSKWFLTKDSFYKGILKRIGIFGLLALILAFIPPTRWIEIKYKNHPDYIKAHQAAWDGMSDRALWDKAEEEREKMYEAENN